MMEVTKEFIQKNKDEKIIEMIKSKRRGQKADFGI